MKKIIQYSVIIIFPIIGILIGYWIAHNLKMFGANFITIGDVIECYIIPFSVFGLIGIYIGAIYLEKKL